MANTIDELLEDIEREGFDYSLDGYSDCSEIPDQNFQELYKAFMEAKTQLADFLGVKT